MRFVPSWLRRDGNLLPILLLVFLSALITLLHYQLLTREAWQLPSDYGGDSFETLARIKAASEGDTLPLMSQDIGRLGAPFGADWNAYPAPDLLLMLLLGGLSRVFGLFIAANLCLVLAQVAAALSCYWVLRYLRCRWEWAITGALLFAFTYEAFHRGLAHYSFIFTWTIPLGLLSASLIASSKRLRWGTKECWICILSALAFGLHNPYYHYFWLLLIGWALVFQIFGERNWRNVAIGLATVGISLAALFAINIENWLYASEPDSLPLLVRNYSGTERYALKPIEMFIPPSVHRWDCFAFFGNRYFRWTEWRGEFFLPYLGLAGIAALAWLVLETIKALSARKPIPGPMGLIGWLLVFCSIGGVSNILAFFFSFQIFRATNRIAVFISCILLVFLMLRCAKLSQRLPRWGSVLAAALLCAVGLLDQVPRGIRPIERDLIEKRVTADKDMGSRMEAALPKGSMIFQLPVVGFPEVVPPFELIDYEHFRPYLNTSSLRFSYGATKLRSRSQWQNEIAALPLPEMVQKLERLGFAGLYINRRGFPDRGQSVLAQLNALGYRKQIMGMFGIQVLVLLHPAGDAEPPLAHSLTLGQGWYPMPIETIRWAYEDANLSYYNPYSFPMQASLNLDLVCATPGNVELKQEGNVIGRWNFKVSSLDIRNLKVTLKPGVNHFRLGSDGATIRREGGRYQLRKIGLSRMEIAPARPGQNRPVSEE
jgi:hypothetical protein